jgi:hypothetical protein
MVAAFNPLREAEPAEESAEVIETDAASDEPAIPAPEETRPHYALGSSPAHLISAWVPNKRLGSDELLCHLAVVRSAR